MIATHFPFVAVPSDSYWYITFHRSLQKDPGISGESACELVFLGRCDVTETAIQDMEHTLLLVTPIKPSGEKRTRLQVVTYLMRNVTVPFLQTECRNCSGKCSISAWSPMTAENYACSYLLTRPVEQLLKLPKIW